jgi:hypothetical protein
MKLPYDIKLLTEDQAKKALSELRRRYNALLEEHTHTKGILERIQQEQSSRTSPLGFDPGIRHCIYCGKEQGYSGVIQTRDVHPADLAFPSAAKGRGLPSGTEEDLSCRR